MTKPNLNKLACILTVQSLFVSSILFFSTPVKATAPEFSDSKASELFNSINSYRVSQGKKALIYNSKLAQVAKIRINSIYSSQTLITPGDSQHVIPGFGSFGSQAANLGLPVNTAGENFTATTTGLDGALQSWVQSTSHRENILDSDYIYSAIALSTDLQNVGDSRIPSGITGGIVAIQVFSTGANLSGVENNTPKPIQNPETPPSKTTIKQPETTPAKTKPSITKPTEMKQVARTNLKIPPLQAENTKQSLKQPRDIRLINLKLKNT